MMPLLPLQVFKLIWKSKNLPNNNQLLAKTKRLYTKKCLSNKKKEKEAFEKKQKAKRDEELRKIKEKKDKEKAIED